MITLKNVSKYYYRKGMIAAGFTNVDLQLDIGEFVVITGESGSGKSTLLNVISGVDSYEEGEMYIEGRETSHFGPEDFEDYRKKYIGNIFQDFNLVGSYTVYQNVELILLINGYSKEEIKKRVPVILEKVGLAKQAKQKVSKLSGGQQQRVAIARALAKDTSIITADEPTGNLDSESAKEIVELLHEISKDKLVIIVTHNFDQFEKYATRIIKMNDGHIIEDNRLQEVEEAKAAAVHYGSMKFKDKLRIGVRNAFNIVPKFVLLLAVFLFIAGSVSMVYVNLRGSSEARELEGYNAFFQNYTDTRIIVRHKNRSPLTNHDYDTIKSISGVESIAKDDIVLDQTVYIEKDILSFYGFPAGWSQLTKKPDVGESPKNSRDAVIAVSKDELGVDPTDIIGNMYTVENDMMTGDSAKVKITGIVYLDTPNASGYGTIYLSDKSLSKLRNAAYLSFSTITTLANNQKFTYTTDTMMYRALPSKKVVKGHIVVPEEIANAFDGESGQATGKSVQLSIKNAYFKESKKLQISGVYKSGNYRSLTGKANFEENMSEVFINPEDYKSMFTHDNYQSTVFAKDVHRVDDVANALRKDGYKVLPLKDSLTDMGLSSMLDIVQVPLAIILLVAVFFISYFIIRLILRSRGHYFSVLRMLGLPRKGCRRLLDVELITVVLLAFAIFMAIAATLHFVSSGDVLMMNPVLTRIQSLVTQLKVKDYIILIVLLSVLAFLISGRFTRSLFKKTAMRGYREEV